MSDFFDKLLQGVSKMVSKAVRDSETRLRYYERTQTSAEKKEKISQACEKLNKLKPQTENTGKSKSSNQGYSNYSSGGKYLNKSLEQWDRAWVNIGPLKTASLTQYNDCVGLYRHVVKGKTKYLGRAIELDNGGFRKRLSDYRRDSDSARKHPSGQTIYNHLDEITTYILVVGKTQEAIEVTKQLEKLFIRKYAPEWNFMLK